jgi:hypothetical protein
MDAHRLNQYQAVVHTERRVGARAAAASRPHSVISIRAWMSKRVGTQIPFGAADWRVPTSL